jgi:DNA-binding CsgD family transcriptional regulator
VRLSDLMSQRQFRATAIYQDFYRLVGVDQQLAFALPSPSSAIIGLAMNRLGRPVSERERALAEALRPHMARAYQNASAITRMSGRPVAAPVIWDQVGEPVVILDHSGRAVAITDQAARLLARYYRGARREDDGLPEELAAWFRRQVAWLRHDTGIGTALDPLVKSGAATSLVIRLMVPPGGEGFVAAFTERLHRDPAGQLTGRQAEIVGLVAEGLTDKQIGRQLGTSVRTVQKNLERAYRRLGVTTRTAAVRTLYARSDRNRPPRPGAAGYQPTAAQSGAAPDMKLSVDQLSQLHAGHCERAGEWIRYPR